MKIEVKIIEKENYNEENLGWSEGVPIDDFILHPNDIKFSWNDGEFTLSYKDFIFFGNEYYYRIFINGRPEKEYEEYLKELKEYKSMYEDLCK